MKDCAKKDAETKIKAAIGFRHIIDLLSSEQKLIVGHNCFLGRIYGINLSLFRTYHFYITDIHV